MKDILHETDVFGWASGETIEERSLHAQRIVRSLNFLIEQRLPQHLLDNGALRVYCLSKNPHTMDQWSQDNFKDSTHQALLINIEPIPVEKSDEVLLEHIAQNIRNIASKISPPNLAIAPLIQNAIDIERILEHTKGEN